MKSPKSIPGYPTKTQLIWKILLAAILAAGLIFGRPFDVYADDGDIDTTFGTGGIVTTTLDESANDVALQSDGKIIAAGFEHILRFNNDGSLDQDFGAGGVVTVEVVGYSISVKALTLQSEGKIITAGNGYDGENYGFAALRYNSDGTLDIGFGDNGLAFISFGSENHEVNAVALQSDEKIIIAGAYFSDTISWNDVAIAQFESDGTLYSTKTTDFEWRSDRAFAITVQNDDKIVVAGDHHTGTSYDYLVIRYNSNLGLDTSFGTNGIVTTAIGPAMDIANGVALQSDGKIVVAGWCEIGPYSIPRNRAFCVVRYNSDGTLDTTFDNEGFVTTDIGPSYDMGADLAIQFDGKIVVAGYSYNSDGTGRNFTVVRYNSDGSLDNTFSGDGIVTTDINTGSDKGYALAIQSDGKIIVAGSSYFNDESHLALLRYMSTNSYDSYLPIVLID